MKLSWGTYLLFYGAAVLALVLPALKQRAWPKLERQAFKESWIKPVGGLLLAGLFSFFAMLLHLEVASAWPYLLGAAGLFGGLTGIKLSAETRGIILLTAAFALFSRFPETSSLQLPLLASFLGLVLGKLFNPTNWEDFILPASWLVGLAWLVSSTPEALLNPQVSLLVIFLSICLLTRGLQALPVLAKGPVWLRPLYLSFTGGLAAWLAVQNMLLQTELLPWVGLLVGGVVLGFLLLNPEESSEAHQPDAQPAPGALQSGLIALMLLGVATLLASRLFGTMGWVVLAVGLMANRKAGSYVTVAALFLLGRVLLQTFLTQYSSNVTGINITHAYASAALYAGFSLMLLLPALINTMSIKALAPTLNTEAKAEPVSNSLQTDFQPTTMALLGLGILMSAGLSNYFLHGEATASLLLAMLVSGLGVSLLGGFTCIQVRALPLLVTLLTIAGALTSPEVLTWGNEAEKSQKLMVLGGALVLVLLIGFLFQRIGSGRKLVQVS